MPEQYAKRLKIGVVTPSTNTTLEPDCHSLCPDGVTVHTARIPIQNKKISGAAAYDDHVKAMRDGIGVAIEQIVTCGPNHVIMGVALEAFWGGVEGSTRLEKELSALTGTRISMGSTSMHRALQAIGAKRIAILTPHMPAGDEQVSRWFTEAGYEIVKLVGLCCESPRLIAEVSLEQMRNTVLTLDSEEPDAIVQVGTNLQFRRIAAASELLLGKPVLALNAVMLWDSLRLHGIRDPLVGLGQLFES
ncbi:MAG: hypothetical protein AB8B63_11790 [Granulosicoccus sp.]